MDATPLGRVIVKGWVGGFFSGCCFFGRVYSEGSCGRVLQ